MKEKWERTERLGAMELYDGPTPLRFEKDAVQSPETSN